MSKIVTHEKFGGEEVINKLRDAGVEVDAVVDSEAVEEMGLKEPVYGEATVGECTVEETAVFHELWQVNRDLEDRSRTLVGESLASVGKSIRDSDRNKPMSEVVQSGELDLAFGDDDTEEAYFRLQQRAAMLHAMFWWLLGERLSLHRYRLGVRSKLRIVRMENRYKRSTDQ